MTTETRKVTDEDVRRALRTFSRTRIDAVHTNGTYVGADRAAMRAVLEEFDAVRAAQGGDHAL
jgi:hypothetical protein